MIRQPIAPRSDLNKIAADLGFNFHIIDGDPYWVEDRFYQFTLKQIEQGLEDPTEEINRMCLDLVEEVVNSPKLMDKLCIPKSLQEWIEQSWKQDQPTLYGRLDFAYNGKGHAKFLEGNYQTPTSIYEAAYFQWVWLQNQVDRGNLPRQSDQFNCIQEALIKRFEVMADRLGGKPLFFSCCKDTDEDRATVQYLQDCAHQAGCNTGFVYIEDIGIANEYHGSGEGPHFVFSDLSENTIEHIFMLYPYEMMFEDEGAAVLPHLNVEFLEPPWKAILSNKGILPLLWERYPGHPNLLPSYFEGEEGDDLGDHFVVKPLFSREGANIQIFKGADIVEEVDGPYGGDVPKIKQAHTTMPKFGDQYTLIGSWIVGDRAVGLTIREDTTSITKDSSQFIPHIILGE